MQINDHPVWIKVDPTMNRFAYYQNGYWNIGNLNNLPKMLKENALDPKKKFIGYLSSKNQVEFFQEAIWNDGQEILKPHPEGDGKVVAEGVKPGANKTEEELKKEEDEEPEAQDTDKPMEKRDDSEKE